MMRAPAFTAGFRHTHFLDIQDVNMMFVFRRRDDEPLRQTMTPFASPSAGRRLLFLYSTKRRMRHQREGTISGLLSLPDAAARFCYYFSS